MQCINSLRAFRERSTVRGMGNCRIFNCSRSVVTKSCLGATQLRYKCRVLLIDSWVISYTCCCGRRALSSDNQFVRVNNQTGRSKLASLNGLMVMVQLPSGKVLKSRGMIAQLCWGRHQQVAFGRFNALRPVFNLFMIHYSDQKLLKLFLEKRIKNNQL